jgi:DNA invertase Pin-like site-specific DNA recombinase
VEIRSSTTVCLSVNMLVKQAQVAPALDIAIVVDTKADLHISVFPIPAVRNDGIRTMHHFASLLASIYCTKKRNRVKLEAKMRQGVRQNRRMKVGYARHSGTEQKKSDVQLAVLQRAGCDTFFVDDGQSKGEKLKNALAALGSGDSLVVAKFDRLGKTIKGVVDLLNELAKKSITFVAVEDAVDTSTADGRYLVLIMSRLALMDKALRNERTKASLAIAKKKGRTGGRPQSLTQEKWDEAKKLIDGGMPVRAVAKIVGSSQATLYRVMGAKRAE